MGGIFSRYTRTDEVDALETPAEPDRVGLTPTEQILLTWVFHDKCKVHTKYSKMHAYWVQVNFQALCYYKPKLIERIDTSSVACLTIYKNKLFSGSYDSTIRVWDADTHAQVATIEGHTREVRCLTIYKNKLFSSIHDGTIRVWNLDE